MSNIVLVSDFIYPDKSGGAELVDKTVADYVSAICIPSTKIKEFREDTIYVISNISLLSKHLLEKLPNHPNYIILEHDYKICQSRHPWRYKDSILPKNERINYNIYSNAKAVFVQTTDHWNVFKNNEVPGRFINLECSIWSDKELDVLMQTLTEIEICGRKEFAAAIIDSDNWIKNTNGCIEFCKKHNINYQLIRSDSWETFIKQLSQFPLLVSFPIARESCCRLVVEARCLNMNVLTYKDYGAVLEPWFGMNGYELIIFLRQKSKANLQEIKDIIDGLQHSYS